MAFANIFSNGFINMKLIKCKSFFLFLFVQLFLSNCNFIKNETLAQVFSCEFCKISKNTFLHKTPLVAPSVLSYFMVFFTCKSYFTDTLKYFKQFFLQKLAFKALEHFCSLVTGEGIKYVFKNN